MLVLEQEVGFVCGFTSKQTNITSQCSLLPEKFLFDLNDLLLVVKAKLLWDLGIVKIGPKRAEKCFHDRAILLMP